MDTGISPPGDGSLTPPGRLTDEFSDRYGRLPEVVIRAPGRVNLIGDHTDYNNGFVLPIATEQALWLASSPRTDRTVHISSSEFGEAVIDLDRLEPSRTWVDYVAGTLAEMDPAMDHGFDAFVLSELPTGAGLSSSAALEMAVARLAAAVGEIVWDPIGAAHAAQRAENRFVGVPCGIMDQLTVGTALEGHALLIDCRSLETAVLPVPEAATVVVLDTGTRRRLVDSRYERRREQCMQAAGELGVASLREADVDLVENTNLSSRLRRIARHVVTENERALAAARSLEVGDLDEFGHLMNQSHVSLRDDFEVSSPALDRITDLARREDGCFGARMTGAGFGGSAVALVSTGHLAEFVDEVSAVYGPVGGSDAINAPVYPTRPGNGVNVA